MRKLGAILWILIFASPVLASPSGGGSEAGNGGSGIVCRNEAGGVKSVELLDFYEGRQIYGHVLELGPKSLDPYEKVALFLNRLKEFGLSESSFAELTWLVEYFQRESKFYSGSRLVEIPDTNGTLIPDGCKQEQLAIQRKPVSPSNEAPYFSVSQDLWEHLSFDSDQKAGLILHEIFYFASLNYNFRSPHEVTNSRRVRRFVSLFASEIPRPSLAHLAGELDLIGYGTIRYGEVSCKVGVGELEFYDYEKLQYCSLAKAYNLSFQGKSRQITAIGFTRDGVVDQFKLAHSTLLRAGGNRLWFAPESTIRLSAPERIAAGEVYYDSEVRFFEPGRVAGSIDLRLAGKPHDRIALWFSPEGELLQCQSCQGSVTIGGLSLPIGPDLTGTRSIPYSSYALSSEPGPYGWWLFLGAETLYPVSGSPAYWAAATRLILKSDRKVYSGTLSRPLELTLQGRPFKVIGEIVFQLESKIEGALDEATLAENAVLPSCGEGELPFLAGMTLNFSDDGECVKVVKAASVAGGLQ